MADTTMVSVMAKGSLMHMQLPPSKGGMHTAEMKAFREQASTQVGIEAGHHKNPDCNMVSTD